MEMNNDFLDLISKARKGDRHAFACLYESIYKDLFRYAYFTLKNKQNAEDAVSEAVIDAYKSMAKLKNESSFKAWFFKILSVKCKNRLKELYNLNALSEIVPENISYTNDLDDSLDLQKAMEKLTNEERMIISLTVFGGYNSLEISKITKINRNTVRTKYNRALEKLEKELTSPVSQPAKPAATS